MNDNLSAYAARTRREHDGVEITDLTGRAPAPADAPEEVTDLSGHRQPSRASPSPPQPPPAPPPGEQRRRRPQKKTKPNLLDVPPLDPEALGAADFTSASMLAFPAPGKELSADIRTRAVAAMAVFNGVVWFERSYYFKTLDSPPPLETATNWLADVAAMDHISSYGPKATQGLGRAGNRSASQKKAAKAYGHSLLEQVKPDSLIAFTDGASKGNPGPCGSGAFVYDKTKTTGWNREASAALGHGTNNAGELWAIGIALELAQARLTAHSHPYKQLYIFTDSQFTRGVLTMGWRSLTHPGLAKALKLSIRNFPIPVIVDWVPAHVGIDSNERADQLADLGAKKSAKDGPNVDVAADFDTGHFIPRLYDG